MPILEDSDPGFRGLLLSDLQGDRLSLLACPPEVLVEELGEVLKQAGAFESRPGGPRVVPIELKSGPLLAHLVWEESLEDRPFLLGGYLRDASEPGLEVSATASLELALRECFSHAAARTRESDRVRFEELLVTLEGAREADLTKFLDRDLAQELAMDLVVLAYPRPAEGPFDASGEGIEILALSRGPLERAFWETEKEGLVERLSQGIHRSHADWIRVRDPKAGLRGEFASKIWVPISVDARGTPGVLGLYSQREGAFLGPRLLWLKSSLSLLGAAFLRTHERARGQLEDDGKVSEEARWMAEMALTRRLQKRFTQTLPAPPEPLELGQVCRMSHAVGGDFLAGRCHPDGTYVFAVADVSGKGLPAGLLMAHTRGALLALWQQTSAPEAILKALNAVVLDSTDDYAFVTMMVFRILPGGQRIEFASAGHEPLSIWKDTGPISIRKGKDPPLGVIPDHEFHRESFLLEPGGFFSVLTDGILDAAAPSGERFSRERFDQVLQRGWSSPQELVAGVVEELESFLGSAEAGDDFTCLALHRAETSM